MIYKLALLSGKGGSGKTTIALSLAKMLSSCGIRTLLIDCDTATNGATYFFETKLERKNEFISLSNLFCNYINIVEKSSLLNVGDNFWFIPSNVSFPNDTDVLSYDKNDNFIDNIKSWSDFDVIIFDCQAGYSRILNTILEVSTTNLVVLEPDAISSSSIRVLYAQVSALIEKVKTYQIFNKITDEEYTVYNQILGGTTFPPLPPVKFNWEVRKAFAFAKIPEMISTNVEFGKNVFALANLLFPAFERKLFAYTRKILIQEKEEIRMKIQELNVVEPTYTFSMKMIRVKRFVLIVSMLLLFAGFLFVFISNVKSGMFFDFLRDSFLSKLLLSAMFCMPLMFFTKLDVGEYQIIRLKQKRIQFDIIKLEKRFSEIDRQLVDEDDSIRFTYKVARHQKR
jgi:flagellar biosynthesis protein FlhG